MLLEAVHTQARCARQSQPHTDRPVLLVVPSALRLQAALLRLLCTLSTAEKTFWRPTSGPSTPRVRCECPHGREQLSCSCPLTAVSAQGPAGGLCPQQAKPTFPSDLQPVAGRPGFPVRPAAFAGR